MGALQSKIKHHRIKYIFTKKKYIDYLCDDIWQTIIFYLNIKEFCRISKTCSYFHVLTCSDKYIIQRYWKRFCVKSCPNILSNGVLDSYTTNCWHKLYPEILKLNEVLSTHDRCSRIMKHYFPHSLVLLACAFNLITIFKMTQPTYGLNNIISYNHAHIYATFVETAPTIISGCRTSLDYAVCYHSCDIVAYILSEIEHSQINLASTECIKLLKICLSQKFRKRTAEKTNRIMKLLTEHPNWDPKLINSTKLISFYIYHNIHVDTQYCGDTIYNRNVHQNFVYTEPIIFMTARIFVLVSPKYCCMLLYIAVNLNHVVKWR